MKLTMTNNPVANRKRRYWMLEKRKRKLSAIARGGDIEYNDDAVACAFYPNLDPRRTRAQKLRRRIRDEQRQIAKWIHNNGYNLA